MAASKLTLYCSLTSPYARRVRVMTRELGVALDIEEVVVDPFSSPGELLAHNPLSKIPVLVNEAGLSLPDSGLILRYLLTECARPARPLPEGIGDWQAARRLALVEGVIDASVAIVMENRRPESIRFPTQIDRQKAVIDRALAALAEEIEAIEAESADPTAVSLATALAYLDFRLPWLEWRKAQPVLSAWLDHIAQRPSMRDTRPPDAITP